MNFNENSLVKIPTILHLMRLGYGYQPLEDPSVKWDKSTNIFTEIVLQSITRINPELNDLDSQQCLADLTFSLENEDIGKVFQEKLINKSGVRLIDLENFNNNTFFGRLFVNFTNLP